MDAIATVDFRSYPISVAEVMDRIGARKLIAKQSSILIKPNLINDSSHPVTTPPECCEAIVEYIRSCSRARIVIAEGCGQSDLETDQVFKRLGYVRLSKEKDVPLVDLNQAPLVELTDEQRPVFPKMVLPKILFSNFIISVPVLKAHSFSKITGTLKNMIGAAPPKVYGGRYGSWKKAAFHNDMHRAIVDLNRYRKPDLSLMDATIGLADYHLGGSRCNPPKNKLIAGIDPVQVDREAANLLGIDWRTIDHLCSSPTQ